MNRVVHFEIHAADREMMVNAFEGVLNNFLQTMDPLSLAKQGYAFDDDMELEFTFWPLVRQAERFKETDPLEYCLRVFEAAFLVNQEGFSNHESGVENAMMFIAKHRSPDYVDLVSHLYQNARSEHPDPKIFLHEFQRMTAPLLERLRNKAIGE